MQRPPVDLPLAALETMQGGLSVGRFPMEQLYPQRGAQAPDNYWAFGNDLYYGDFNNTRRNDGNPETAIQDNLVRSPERYDGDTGQPLDEQLNPVDPAPDAIEPFDQGEIDI